jgi:hypothetical protein
MKIILQKCVYSALNKSYEVASAFKKLNNGLIKFTTKQFNSLGWFDFTLWLGSMTEIWKWHSLETFEPQTMRTQFSRENLFHFKYAFFLFVDSDCLPRDCLLNHIELAVLASSDFYIFFEGSVCLLFLFYFLPKR